MRCSKARRIPRMGIVWPKPATPRSELLNPRESSADDFCVRKSVRRCSPPPQGLDLKRALSSRTRTAVLNGRMYGSATHKSS